MTEVIPAIMPRNFSDLKEKVVAVAPFVCTVQIDLMDGIFVPERTWPYFSNTDADFAKLLSEDQGLPLWEKIDYEVDLMSATSESDVFDWIKAGAKRIIIHTESTEELLKLIGEIRAEFGRPLEDPTAPQIGIAALNDTPLEEWKHFIPEVDFVQVMGIGRIGYQKQPFDERSLSRITQLREMFPELIISVDGGVHADTAERLVKAGANRLVSGSFIFESPSIKAAIDTLGSFST